MESEDRLIRWLRRRTGAAADAPGDDVAFLPAGGELAVSVDQQVQGVHFVDDLEPRAVGRRLVRVCLSDLAAAGAVPHWAFLALGLPSGFPTRRLLEGVLQECRTFELKLAGGDVARAERLHATLTVAGRRTPRGRWLRRGGAVAGDRLWIGGDLGESAAGRELVRRGARPAGGGVRLPETPALRGRLAAAARRAVRRHLLPPPQLGLGGWLARRRRAAAIDVSDGFALDLQRLCHACGLGAVVERESLPAPRRLNELCGALGLDPEDALAGGGEDYVLLFSLPPSARVPADLGCTPIGRLTPDRRIRLQRAGRLEPLAAAGWDHLLGDELRG